MLEITESAADVIKQVRAESNLPDSAVLRLEMVREQEQTGIRFAFAGGPEEGDHTISETEGLSVFLDPELAEPLAEAVLDTREAGGSIELELRDREGAHDHHDHDHDHEGHAH